MPTARPPSLCDARARHPSPAFMCEGWRPRFHPAGPVASADREPSTGGVSAWNPPLPCFAPVEDADIRMERPSYGFLKGVCATEHLEEEFAVFRAARDGSSQLRMSAEDLSPLDKFVRDASREVGKPFVEECSKSIEVVERVERPVDLYWPAHGRNPGVPHVRSHCTTRSRDTREPSAALVQLATMRLTLGIQTPSRTCGGSQRKLRSAPR